MPAGAFLKPIDDCREEIMTNYFSSFSYYWVLYSRPTTSIQSGLCTTSCHHTGFSETHKAPVL
jgi:hypothetical protein